MLALCKLTGVTEAPDTDVILLLLDHIQEHHSDFSKEEIQNAFSLAMADKLDFEFRHYNRMTPQLVSHTLNSYKTFRSKEILAYENKLREEEREAYLKSQEPTPVERILISTRRTISALNEYRETKTYNDWGNSTYTFLDLIGLIPFTNEEKQEIKDKAQELLIAEKNAEANKIGRSAFTQKLERAKAKRDIQSILAGESDDAIVIRAKELALYKYFDVLIENKRDILDEIHGSLLESEDETHKEAAEVITNEKSKNQKN